MYHENGTKKSGNKGIINTLIVTIFTVTGVIVSFMAYKESIKSNSNSVLFEKPSINLKPSYADEETLYPYIEKVAVEVTGGQAVSRIKIDVEPYLNVFFYLPNEKSLVREILPVWDVEKTNHVVMPYNLRFSNTSHGQIAEVSLNENSYSIIGNICSYCYAMKYNGSYDTYLTDIFGEKILTSISLEYYIIIDYYDNLGNPYKNIYLCTTGCCYFTDNAGGSLDDKSDVSENIRKSNFEDYAIYCKLKFYLENPEFDAALNEVSQDDIVFQTYYDFCSRQTSTPDYIQYVVAMDENLYKLINCAYDKKQLLFFIDQDTTKWSILE